MILIASPGVNACQYLTREMVSSDDLKLAFVQQIAFYFSLVNFMVLMIVTILLGTII